jgi:hypothetical protein
VKCPCNVSRSDSRQFGGPAFDEFRGRLPRAPAKVPAQKLIPSASPSSQAAAWIGAVRSGSRGSRARAFGSPPGPRHSAAWPTRNLITFEGFGRPFSVPDVLLGGLFRVQRSGWP